MEQLMTMFIATEHGDITLRTVTRITEHDRKGDQYAITDDGERHRIIGEDEVLRVTGTIVPASPGEVAYLVFYDEHEKLFVHLKDRIVAWRIGSPWNIPITASYGYGESINSCESLFVYQRADGKFEDPGMRTFDNIEAIEQELISRRARKNGS
jgi:hypothetical protein